MNKLLLSLLAISLSSLAQMNSVGLSLKSLQSEGIGTNLSLEGSYFNIHDDYLPLAKYMSYIDYAADIGVISVGSNNKKAYVDIDVKIDAAHSWLYLPVILPQPTGRYFQDDDLKGYEWGLGTGFGLKVGKGKDPRNFIISAHALNGELSEAEIFSGLKNGTEISYDYFKQTADIFEKQSQSRQELLEKHPERFTKVTETKRIDLTNQLGKISGYKLKLKTSLIPLKGGRILLGTEFRSLESSSKSENPIEDTFTEKSVPYTETIDGVDIEKTGYLYSDTVIGNDFDKHELKYSKIEYSVDLGYQKGKIRIWLSRNYRMQELENIISNVKKSKKRITHTFKIGYRF